MKIETGKIINNLKKEPYKDGDINLTVGMVIAEALAGDRTGGKMKLFLLAQKAFDNETIEVDAADLGLIKHAVEQCVSYNNVIVGQALAAIEEAK